MSLSNLRILSDSQYSSRSLWVPLETQNTQVLTTFLKQYSENFTLPDSNYFISEALETGSQHPLFSPFNKYANKVWLSAISTSWLTPHLFSSNRFGSWYGDRTPRDKLTDAEKGTQILKSFSSSSVAYSKIAVNKERDKFSEFQELEHSLLCWNQGTLEILFQLKVLIPNLTARYQRTLKKDHS